MRFLKKEYILFFVLFLILGGYSVYQHITAPKIVYVDLIKVYNEFKYKEEKAKELQQIENRQNYILDSLKLEIDAIKRTYNAGGKGADTLIDYYKMSMNNYQQKQNQFDILKSDLAKKFDDEIWKQLNQYIVDFSKNHSYDLVLGATGAGNVMYANPKYDVTDELVVFVNERYDGKN